MKKISFIIIGAGSRGVSYARYTKEYPEECEVVAVCELRDETRNRFADEYGIPEDRRFRDWHELLDKPKLADAAFICTQDAQHRDPAVALAENGYHLMLEKPMAPNLEDCKAIYDAVKKSGVMFAVCHVLRYTAFNRKMKQMIDSGVIGRVHNIQLLEPIGYWHMAHSFVRGNNRNDTGSSFILLSKSCHDIDLLNYFTPTKCRKVSSFGSLSYFKRENQPAGAADRCTECPEEIESKCPYSALKIYLRDRSSCLDRWPVNVLTPEGTHEAVLHELKTGPYGRCVFACDNNVVDHQIVNMEFEDGAVAGFTMSGFNFPSGREIYIMGDKGALHCTDNTIDHYVFLTNEHKNVTVDMENGLVKSSHGGGDFGLMQSFFAAVRDNKPELIVSGPEVSLESHQIVFAAEKARRNGTVETL